MCLLLGACERGRLLAQGGSREWPTNLRYLGPMTAADASNKSCLKHKDAPWPKWPTESNDNCVRLLRPFRVPIEAGAFTYQLCEEPDNPL